MLELLWSVMGFSAFCGFCDMGALFGIKLKKDGRAWCTHSTLLGPDPKVYNGVGKAHLVPLLKDGPREDLLYSQKYMSQLRDASRMSQHSIQCWGGELTGW